jgi:hypothetical protein
MVVTFDPTKDLFYTYDNFNRVTFGADGGVTESELNLIQDIQNFRRKMLGSVLLSDGFIAKNMLLYVGGILYVPNDAVIYEGEIIPWVDAMSIECTNGDTIYLEISEAEVKEADATIYRNGNLSGGTDIKSTIVIQDERVGVETTRRKQLQVRLVKDNSDETKGYLLVGTIASGTVTDNRSKASIPSALGGSSGSGEGASDYLTLVASSETQSTTRTDDYEPLFTATIAADTSRHSATLKVGLVQRIAAESTGRYKIIVTDGSNNVEAIGEVISSSPVKAFVDMDCSALNDYSEGALWNITVYGKVITGTRYFVDRFIIKASPTDILAGDTLLIVHPEAQFNSTEWQKLDSSAFAPSHKMSPETGIRCLAYVSFGTGVTAVSLKFKAKTYSTEETVQLDFASAGIQNGLCLMPIEVQAPDIEVWGKVTGGSGTAKLEHYECWLEG